MNEPVKASRQSGQEAERARLNKLHWGRTVDPLNLSGSGSRSALRALEQYATADVRMALASLEPLEGRHVLALGDGLALAAVLMARGGARVIVADLSLPRLREGRALARSLGLEDRIQFVVSGAEALPFGDVAFGGAFTKSVLIHTDLPLAAAELARVTSGVGAFIEPMRRNPFVNLYRRLFAPAEWREITTYFGPSQIATLEGAFEEGWSRNRRQIFFCAFLATVFAYVLDWPRAYRVSERALMGLDDFLFRVVPSLRERAWLVVLEARRGRGPGGKRE